MLKFLILAAALFLLFKLFKGDARRKEAREEKEQETLKASGEMVKDPICGSYVSREDCEIRVRSGETVHCFCSYDCRDKFLKQLEGQAEEAKPLENKEG
ncbi:transcriptional regulator [Desulfocurvus sp.]|jgi:YHS domain-containing protein|uniref:transcriptional regulator n=1 Tax=Desulfocurvus sp. TaxID=2871698 RepID=UPI0025C21163|nr:transcriptional regulator [Desulfocurvus sp.]MCK9240519.1 transcriptional regulator [Desulfocurvus sp.]